MAKILYFVTNFKASNSGVFWSQIVEPAKYLVGQGHEVTLCFKSLEDEKLMAKLNDLGIISILYKNRFSSSFAGSFLDSFIALIKVKKLKKSIDYIYIRSVSALIAGHLLSKTSSSKLVYDFRASISAEDKLKKGKKKTSYYLLKIMEWLAIYLPDKFLAVSSPLKETIELSGRKAPLQIVPCCVPKINSSFLVNKRIEEREKMSFEDKDKVIAYSGGFSEWQRTDDIFNILSRVMDSSEQVKFLVLTGNIDKANELAEKHDIPRDRFIVRKVDASEVIGTLSAADAGILLRDDDVVNHVASPIKGAEYLSAGLFVFVSKAVRDMAAVIDEIQCGAVIEGVNEHIAMQINSKIGSVSGMLDKSLDAANTYYNWGAYDKEFREIYV